MTSMDNHEGRSRMYSWMLSMTGSNNLCVETVVLVSSVFYGTNGAVSFMKGIFTVNGVTITNFMLVVMIMGMSISNTVFKLVFWMSL